MKHITLTWREFNSSELLALAKKERRPWIRRRIKAIAYIAKGQENKEAIALRLHTDGDRIRFWIARYNEAGLKGLEDKQGKGAKRTLSPRKEAALKKAMQHSPRKAGVATNLWTGRAVKEYLEKRKWFSCSIQEAYVLIHRLGFSLQRPSRIPIQQNPEATNQFLKELEGKKRGIS